MFSRDGIRKNEKKNKKTRQLAMEILEDRALLSVSSLGEIGEPALISTEIYNDAGRIDSSVNDIACYSDRLNNPVEKSLVIDELISNGSLLMDSELKDSSLVETSLSETAADWPVLNLSLNVCDLQISWEDDYLPAGSTSNSYKLRYKFSNNEVEPYNQWIIKTDLKAGITYTLPLASGTSLEIQIQRNNESWSTSTFYTIDPVDTTKYNTLVDGENVNVFQLHSKADSSKVIYLDFTGHLIAGTEWNEQLGYELIASRAWLYADEIYNIWEQVAEDYLPFDVDVTTEFPGLDGLTYEGEGDNSWGIRVAIGGTCYEWYGSAGGVSYLDCFQRTTDYNSPSFVFAESLGGTKNIAEAVSHEAGHALGLNHDGHSSDGEYYRGRKGWASIMGSGYYDTLVQWSNGSYNGSTNKEDDLSILASKLNYREDDYGNTPETAGEIIAGTDLNILASGIISSSSFSSVGKDYDLFELTAGANVSSYTFMIGGNVDVTNLDVKVTVYAADCSTVVGVFDPPETLYAVVSFEVNPGAVYYIEVTGTGKGLPDSRGGYADGYYSDYGSLGYYSIKTTSIVKSEINISPAEYVCIRDKYLEIELSELSNGNFPDYYNIIVVEAEDLSAAAVKNAISQAGSTYTDDLIILKTTDRKHTITFESASDEILISINSTIMGSVTIVAWGSQKLTVNAAGYSRALCTSNTRADIRMANIDFVNGYTEKGFGGAIKVVSGNFILCDSVISDCESSSGGGIFVSLGKVHLYRCEIKNNKTEGSGGGIYNYSGKVFLNACRIRNNSTRVFQGGGIMTESGSSYLANCLIVNNYAAEYGGGLFNYYGISTIVNCTVVNNSAGKEGSGIALYYFHNSGSIKVYNSIIVKNNSAVSEIWQNINNGITGSNNLTSCPQIFREKDGNYLYNAELELFASGESGNYSIGAGSQARNKGKNGVNVDLQGDFILYDLAGLPRISGSAIDLGAYEYSEYVRLDPPELQAEAIGLNSFKITIGSIKNASGYLLQYFTGTKTQTVQYEYSGTFTLSGFEAGTVCSFQVKALGDGIYLDSVSSETVQAKTYSRLIEAIPDLSVKTQTFLDSRIVLLEISDLSTWNNQVEQWTIQWGDGSETTVDPNGFRWSVLHYYRQTGQFTISAVPGNVAESLKNLQFTVNTVIVPLQGSNGFLSSERDPSFFDVQNNNRTDGRVFEDLVDNAVEINLFERSLDDPQEKDQCSFDPETEKAFESAAAAGGVFTEDNNWAVLLSVLDANDEEEEKDFTCLI